DDRAIRILDHHVSLPELSRQRPHRLRRESPDEVDVVDLERHEHAASRTTGGVGHRLVTALDAGDDGATTVAELGVPAVIVDRIRNGRSFATRRVVARQAVGAILNLEASYQRDEASAIVVPSRLPVVPAAEQLEESSWSDDFERRFVPEAATPPPAIGAGRM